MLISVDLPKKGSSVCPRSLVLQSLFYEAVPIARELRSLHHNVYFFRNVIFFPFSERVLGTQMLVNFDNDVASRALVLYEIEE